MGMHLVPVLTEQGHQVVIGSRTNRLSQEWIAAGVTHIVCNSSDIEDLRRVAKTEKFDVVIDFPGTAWTTWEVFKDKADHVIGCGSVWMYGNPKIVPTPELKQDTCIFKGYEIRYEQIQTMIEESGKNRAVFTAIMPTNICGPGKIPLDTMGGRSVEVHKANMRGDTVYLPDGPQALIMSCDAYDLAMLFALAVNNREAAAGQIFNGGTEYALTASQFVETLAKIHGVQIPIVYIPWQEYKEKYNPDEGAWWHFYAHLCADISKAKRLLGYAPKFTPEESLRRAVEWMKEQKLI